MNALINRLYLDKHLRKSIARLRELEGYLVSPVARFAIPFAYVGYGEFKKVRPVQSGYEIESLYHAVREIAPRRVLEIGTHRGGTLYLWAQAARDNATLVSVDLPAGKFGGGYSAPRAELYRAFAQPEQTMHLLREDSHTQETFQKVQDCFSGDPVDFAFIDGDHSYEGVTQDFAMYGPLVRPGGLIAFHDILPRHGATRDGGHTGVDRHWNAVKDHYDTREFIDPIDPRMGIGLLRVPEGGVRVEGATAAE
ncbi:MAG: class I SAM-dependent methyltransferase [Planctomycetota bacterium]